MLRNLLRAGVIACAILCAPPAATQQTTPAPAPLVIPTDFVSRAKFPKEDARMIDGLSYLNRLVNHSIRGMGDMEHYGVPDKAVSLPDDGYGDCEDYALSKIVLLGQSGVPIVYVTRLRFVMVKTKDGDFGHAILEMKLPKGGIVILDNRFDDLMTRKGLEAAGYKFFDW